MAAGYNFAFQMSLQAPPNADVKQVRRSIEAGLKGIKVNFDAKGAKKASNDINNVGKAAEKAGVQAEGFADTITMKGKSFAAYAVASSAIIKLTGAITNATRDALKLEKELAKIAQVTGRTNREIKANSAAILNISKNYGVASNKVAELVRMLTQTGMSFREAAKGADILARTELLASFDNLAKTTEGLIALMSSFNLSTAQAGKGLEAINVVSKRFAVESGDIVEAIKRTGGAFSAAGGNINELIALFTSVRSTSRESAETIATAFRTIFGRLQRPRTIEFFKQMNIELVTAQGNFVGGYEAVRRISQGLKEAGIAAGSIKFAQVVEQIGGIRQLSKVVPLLTQFDKAQRALTIANQGTIESDKDVAKAKQTLSQQIAELTQNFRALVYEITQTEGFKILAGLFISAANAAIELTRALKPLIPYLGLIAGYKIGKSLLGGLGALRGGAPGMAPGMARGGMVPGKGNRDTVPAMLTPGEFVVRKSATQAFGAKNLANINRYAKGGSVTIKDDIGQIAPKGKAGSSLSSNKTITIGALRKKMGKKVLPRWKGTDTVGIGRTRVKESVLDGKNTFKEGAFVNNVVGPINEEIKRQVKERTGVTSGVRGIKGDNKAMESLGGFAFERYAGAILGLSPGGGGTPFDFRSTDKRTLSKLQGISKNDPLPDFLDAKRAFVGPGQIVDKGLRDSKVKKIIKQNKRRVAAKKATKKAAGGSISGTDTVPALLTPGEFVVNRASAKAVGYGNLRKINKYAKGGVVQRFQDGGDVSPWEGVRKSSGVGNQMNRDIISGNKDTVRSMRESAKATTDNTKATKNLSDKTKGASKSVGGFGARLLGFYGAIQIATGFIQQMGIETNQSAMNAKTGTLALEGSLVYAGSRMEGWGDALEQKGVKGVFAKSPTEGVLDKAAKKRLKGFSGSVMRTGQSLSKFGAKAGVALTKLGTFFLAIDLAGMALETFATSDMGKMRDAAIKSGDATLAAEAAQRKYGQSVLSSIPVVGSLMAAMDSWSGGALAQQVAMDSGMGEMLGQSAGLAATMSAASKTILEASERAAIALQAGDYEEFNKQIENNIVSMANTIGKGASSLASEIRASTQGGAVATGATAGGAAGAVVGAGVGAIFGGVMALPGAAIGGGIGAAIGAISGAFTYASTTIAASEVAIEGFTQRAEHMTNALGMVAPAMDDIIRKSILMGKTEEEARGKATGQIGGAMETVGVITSKKQLEHAKKMMKNIEKAEERHGKKRVEIAGFYTGIKVAEAKLKMDEAETESEKKILKARIAAGEATLGNIEMSKAQRAAIDLVNEGYRNQLTTLRALADEFAAFDEKMDAVRDAASEMQITGTGKMTARGLATRTGTEQMMKGNLGDIGARKGGLKQLVGAAGLFGADVEAGAKKAVGMQERLTGLKSGKVDIGTMDPETLVKDLLGEAAGGAVGKILVKDITSAQAGGMSAEGIMKKMEAAVDKEGKAIVSQIQKGMAELQGFVLQYQDGLVKYQEMLIANAQKANEIEQRYADQKFALDKERINSLKSIGMSDNEAANMQKDLLKDRMADQKKLRATQTDRIRGVPIATAGMGGGPPSKRRAIVEDQLTFGRTGGGSSGGGVLLDKLGVAEKKTELALNKKDISLLKEKIALDVQAASAQRENIKALQESRGALAEELAFGTDEARAGLLESANVTMTAMQRGSMSGFSGEQRGQVSKFLGRFTGMGGAMGEQARAAKGRLGAQELVEMGAIAPQDFEQVARDIARAEEPMDKTVARGIKQGYLEIQKLEAKNQAIEGSLLKGDEKKTELFATKVDSFAAAIDTFVVNMGQEKIDKAKKTLETAKDERVGAQTKFQEEKEKTEKFEKREAQFKAAQIAQDIGGSSLGGKSGYQRLMERTDPEAVKQQEILKAGGVQTKEDFALISGQITKSEYEKQVGEGSFEGLQRMGKNYMKRGTSKEDAARIVEEDFQKEQKFFSGLTEEGRREAKGEAPLDEKSYRMQFRLKMDEEKKARAGVGAAEAQKAADDKTRAEEVKAKIDSPARAERMRQQYRAREALSGDPTVGPQGAGAGAERIIAGEALSAYQSNPLLSRGTTRGMSQEDRLKANIGRLEGRGAKQGLIDTRKRELKTFQDRKREKAEEVQSREAAGGAGAGAGAGATVSHDGQLTLQLTGLEGLAAATEGSNNVNIGQGVAAGLRIVADNIDGSDGSPQSTAAALRAGAESQVMVGQA